MNPKMIKIRINDEEVSAPEGIPLLQVAEDAGHPIPHFCYHPGLGVDGNCRLCMVEIKGQPKLATSCTVPVKEGLEVYTQSESVKKARKGVLEFFLLNHPLDCPFCDKGGECPLQNFTLDAGQFASRFLFEKRHKPKHQVIGQHILLDKERCVLCSRCVRFGRDLTGHEELQIAERGGNAEIMIPEGTQLTTGFTGNLADICPVGALTTREFRFRARPWEMKVVDSLCGECSLGCNVQIWKKGRDVLRQTPRIAPEVNEWWLCDRGRFSIHELSQEERLVSGKGIGIDPPPDTAEEVMKGLKREAAELRRKRVAFVVDAQTTNEELFQLKSWARETKEGKVFLPVAAETREFLKRLGEKKLEGTFPQDLEKAKSVLVLGEEFQADHPVLLMRLRGLHREQGTQIVTVGEHPAEFRDISDHHWKVESEDQREVLEEVLRWERDQAKHPKLPLQGPVFVFLAEKWIGPKTIDLLKEWLFAAQRGDQTRICLLTEGTNTRGMLDQWDEQVCSQTELNSFLSDDETELVVFGNARDLPGSVPISMQWVWRERDGDRSARWLLPRETFVEKSGTITNTFGRVQVVRRAASGISRSYRPETLLNVFLEEMGVSRGADTALVYREFSRKLPTYPQEIEEIIEPRQTYEHYERALRR